MRECLYCGNRCVSTAVYVIGERCNAPSVKVGYSTQLSKRLAKIRKSSGRDVRVLGSVTAKCLYKAMDIEGATHAALAPFWTGRGEWFSCAPEHALLALERVSRSLGLDPTRP